MTLAVSDGFDFYTSSTSFSKNWSILGSPTLNFVAGRYDGRAVSYSSPNPNTGLIRQVSGFTAMTVGFAFRFSATLSNPTIICQIQDTNNNDMFYFQINRTTLGSGNVHYITVFNKTGQIGRSKFLKSNFNVNIWNYFEVEIFSNNSTGSVNLYLNSKRLINLANINTTSSTNSTVMSKIFFPTISGSTLSIDDFYVSDTNIRLGEAHIATLKANNDVQIEWGSSGTGSHYSKINSGNFDSPVGYITTDVIGAEDIFEIQDLSTVTSLNGSIVGVNLKTYSYASNTNPANLALEIKINNSSHQTPGEFLEFPASAAKIIQTGPIIISPDTMEPWTLNEINNLQIGIINNSDSVNTNLVNDFDIIRPIDLNGNPARTSGAGTITNNYPGLTAYAGKSYSITVNMRDSQFISNPVRITSWSILSPTNTIIAGNGDVNIDVGGGIDRLVGTFIGIDTTFTYRMTIQATNLVNINKIVINRTD